MSFQIIKVLNNNAVLAQNSANTQMVLLSKGIGFGRKPKEFIEENRKDQKIFYIFEDSNNINKLQQFRCDDEKISMATKKIVEMAREELNIQNEEFYKILLDHITFAVECVQLGIPMDNPFTNEISILYSEEYDVARKSLEIIEKYTGVKMNEAEEGYIALHLYSARYSVLPGKRVKSIMKNTKVYGEILHAISSFSQTEFNSTSSQAKSFLLALHQIVQCSSQNKPMAMPLKREVCLEIPEYYAFAKKIAEFIQHQLNIIVSSDGIAWIAVDLYQALNL